MKSAIAIFMLASPALAQVALQPKWDVQDRGAWTAEDFARVKASQGDLWVKPKESKCLETGQPADCGGYVFGTSGAVKPDDRRPH